MDEHEELEYLENEILRLSQQGEPYEVIQPKTERYFEILQDIRTNELSEEIWWAATLIENEKIPSNIFNTFEWVNTCVEQLKDPTTMPHLAETYPEADDWQYPDLAKTECIFDDDWRDLETLENFGKLLPQQQDEFFYKENGVYFNPIEILLSDVRTGHLPNPELLLSLAKAFDLYFISNGKLSLEDVFFGPKTRLGSYAIRRNESFKGISFKSFEHSVRRSSKKTIEEMAEIFIQQEINNEAEEDIKLEDADAFLRKYRRWKKRQGISKNRKKPLSNI